MTDTAGSLAAQYVARGWPVFPCHAPTPGGCSCCRPDCSSPGKHPRTARGFQDASRSAKAVSEWWRRWPTANVGVVTGRPSGLVVVDIDPRHGGIESMQRLVRAHGPLPDGPRVRTGSGGWHLLFSRPDHSIRNSVNQVGAGIDVRADGGYVVAPPSMHSTGGRYVWTRVGEPSAMPSWLERLIDPPQVEHRAVPEPIQLSAALDGWAAAALRGEVERVRRAPNGTRNHTLNRAAFALGQIAGAGIIETTEVESHLHARGSGRRPRGAGGVAHHQVRPHRGSRSATRAGGTAALSNHFGTGAHGRRRRRPAVDRPAVSLLLIPGDTVQA